MEMMAKTKNEEIREPIAALEDAKKINVGLSKRPEEFVFLGFMSQPTRYDLRGSFTTILKKVLTFSRVEMTSEIELLRYLLGRLDKLDDPMLMETWKDIVETWQALFELTSTMKGEMAQMVLKCIFSDRKVLQALAFAKLVFEADGPVPTGLLTVLKRDLTGHMKSRFYVYQKEINKEIVSIERIINLQQLFVSFIGSVIVSVMVGFSTFASNYVSDHYFPA